MIDNPIIIALDVDTAEEALRIVEAVGEAADVVKVGMELYAVAGMSIVTKLHSLNKQVFLDLKLYDISETVKRATKAIAAQNVSFLTVHGSGAVMRAAAEGKGNARTKLLAVTVLTSFDADDLADLGYPPKLTDLVDLRVRKAVESGMDGIVCSPLEVARVRALAGSSVVLITPGVRSAGSSTGDQKRVATPKEALENGADYIVVGRQVTRAANPEQAYRAILQEVGR